VLIVTADDGWQASELYKEGADYVLIPHFIGGRELAEILEKDLSGLKELRERDLKELKNV